MQNYNFDGVEIPFDPTWKNIAISVSGGADSALLAYTLCDLIPRNQTSPTIHIISFTRCWKTKPWQHYDSIRIYDFLVDKFPNLKFKRHTSFIAPELEYSNKGPIFEDEYGKQVSGDNIEKRAFAEFICHLENCDAFYNAVTRNPRSLELGGMKERDIERNETNLHLEKMKHMDRWALHPFRFVAKDWIVRQYKNRGLLELFHMTRSCEGEFDGLDYKTYVPGQEVPTCGECFWCKEREWAIEQSK